MKLKEIFLTEQDHADLLAVTREHPDHVYTPFLEREVRRAKVVHEEDLPDNVVSLHSKVRVLAEHSNQTGELTVVPPDLAHLPFGHVSVLSPVGAAVIGLSAGDTMELDSPCGLRRRFRVLDVEYQPEAEKRNCVAS